MLRLAEGYESENWKRIAQRTVWCCSFFGQEYVESAPHFCQFSTQGGNIQPMWWCNFVCFSTKLKKKDRGRGEIWSCLFYAAPDLESVINNVFCFLAPPDQPKPQAELECHTVLFRAEKLVFQKVQKNIWFSNLCRFAASHNYGRNCFVSIEPDLQSGNFDLQAT